MSGHSKWAQIRRAKGVNDARRGQLFTRLGREIVVAVREGGSGDPNINFRLRLAVQRARDANMPMENIERTIKRALGGSEGAALEEITYEGYGPGGAAVLVQALTENRNRTVDEVRTIYTDPSDLEKIRQALESKKYRVVKAESTLQPKTKIELNDEKVAHQVMHLVERLEDLDDVQNVYTNADFPEAFAASYEG